MLSKCYGPFNNVERSLIVDSIKQHVEENYNDFFPTLGKRTRETEVRPNYWNSTWGKMLRDPLIKYAPSKVSKKFRRRFRVPYALFKKVIVPQCKEANVFNMKHNSTVLIELRVLIALGILGRDAVCDECEELSNLF